MNIITNTHTGSAVIVSGARTPFVKMGGGLAALDAADLGRIAVDALLTRTGIDPDIIDETIFGCVSQPADAANVARVIALRAGVPAGVPAMTVQRNCGSGLEALTTAAGRIAAGRGDAFIVGGTESMSSIPLLFAATAAAKFAAVARSRSLPGRAAAMLRFRPADFAPLIALRLGLTDPVAGMNMGETAELLAREFDISRRAQDAFACHSHRKAIAARQRLREEICPVYHQGGDGGHILDDNGPREGQSIEKLAKLRPVFEPRTGTVTAGNSSQLTDGAVALLVTSEARASSLGLEPIGRLVDYAHAGCEPKRMGLGPAHAISALYRRTALRPKDADLIEINEAFAAQVLAVAKTLQTPEFDGLELPIHRLNPNGGAIALGHPVGATGARLVLAALHELRRTGGRRALISLCIAGGQGIAAWLERP